MDLELAHTASRECANELAMPPSPSPLVTPALSGQSAARQQLNNDNDHERFCFVCEAEDGGELLRVCKCKNRWLHLECQRQLMQRTATHRAGCPICSSPYCNVEMMRTKRRLTSDGRRMIAYVAGVVAVIFIAVYELIMFCVDRHPGFLIACLLFVTNAAGFSVFGYLVYRRVPTFEATAAEVRLSRRQVPIESQQPAQV